MDSKSGGGLGFTQSDKGRSSSNHILDLLNMNHMAEPKLGLQGRQSGLVARGGSSSTLHRHNRPGGTTEPQGTQTQKHATRNVFNNFSESHHLIHPTRIAQLNQPGWLTYHHA
jgi:hypothetical protein